MQARTNLANKQTTAGRNTQTRDDCKFSYQNKYRTLQKWITAILSVTKTETLLKGRMAAIRVVK